MIEIFFKMSKASELIKKCNTKLFCLILEGSFGHVQEHLDIQCVTENKINRQLLVIFCR